MSVDRDGIETQTPKQGVTFEAACGHALFDARALGCATEVDPSQVPVFGVAQGDDGVDRGQRVFEGIFDQQGDNVVAFGGDLQCAVVALVQEIAEHEDDGAPTGNLREVIEGDVQVCALAFPRPTEEVADDAQDVFSSFLGRDEVFDVVGEDHESHAIVVSDGGEGEHGGDFGDELRFASLDASEAHGGGGIDGDQYGQFAFFDEFLDEEIAGARGDVPVEEADVIARGVGLDFIEVHAASLEHGVVFAGEARRRFAACHELKAAYLAEKVALEHGG